MKAILSQSYMNPVTQISIYNKQYITFCYGATKTTFSIMTQYIILNYC